MSCSWRSLRPTVRVGNLLGWEVGRDGRHRRHRDGIRGKQSTDRSSPSLHASRVVVPEFYPSCITPDGQKHPSRDPKSKAGGLVGGCGVGRV